MLFPSPFAQSSHLQSKPHAIPELKHSQYFFWHCVFLQLHPFPSLFFLALIVLALIAYWAWAISLEWLSLLEQPQHEQSSVHSFPDEKHSQYIFRHFVFLQMHPFFRFLMSEADERRISGFACRRFKSIEIYESKPSYSLSGIFFPKLIASLAVIYLLVSMKRRVKFRLGH